MRDNYFQPENPTGPPPMITTSYIFRISIFCRCIKILNRYIHSYRLFVCGKGLSGFPTTSFVVALGNA